MTTYTELLPATKTSAHNGITWTPSGTTPRAGLLKLMTSRAYTTYLVVETPGTYPVRNFLFAKAEGSPGTDPSQTSYTVSVGVAGSPVGCTCKGFAYGKGKPCLHIAAAQAVLDCGWLDSPVNPDADVSGTEPAF